MQIDELVEQIMGGEYDEELAKITSAIQYRKEYLGNRTLALTTPGTRVRVKYGNIRPKYLQGCEGTVTKVNNKTVSVQFDKDPMYHPRVRNNTWSLTATSFERIG